VSALASPPSRSTGTFTLACGLLSIDLAVYSGTEETRVPRHEYVDGDPTRPVGRVQVDKGTGEVIDGSRVVKMCTASNGTVIAVNDDVLRLSTLPSGQCQIVAFVPDADVSRYITENVYQVRVKRHGEGKNSKANLVGEKAFAVVLAGMRARGVCALVLFALRGPARYGLLTADGNLYPVFTHDRVRAALPMPDPAVSGAEVEMMGQLIDYVGVAAPVIEDETSRQVQAMVDALVDGGEVPSEPDVPVIIDLMAALGASIDAAKAARQATTTKEREVA